MKIHYYGHSSFLLETADAKLLIDPFLDGNPTASIKASDVECDYILLTHAHDDHFGDTLAIAERTGATVISNFEICSYCMSKGTKGHPMHIGGSHAFPFGSVKLTIAHHGSTLTTEDGPLTLGQPAGIIVRAEGKCVYHAGDTGLFYDMKLIGEMEKPDVALLPIGDNFTMGIDDAAKAVEFLNPKVSIPMHFNTFDMIAVDAAEFVKKAPSEVRVMQAGEVFEL